MTAVDTLNRLFTSAADLEKLDQAVEYTALAKAYTETQLAQRSTVVPDLDLPTGAVREAAQRLQAKTQDTRREVQAMTAEIKALDTTKHNLVASVTMLKRLQMLTKLHAQLDTQLRKREYRQIAQTLGAATELSAYFCDFRSVPHVAHLSQQVADQRQRIAAQAKQDVCKSVEDSAAGAAGAASASTDLEWACRALPPADRDEILKWYTDRALESYTQVFAPGSEASGIDNVDRRYGMLRNILTKHQALEQRTFPREWAVGAHLAKAACAATERDMAGMRFGSLSNSMGHSMGHSAGHSVGDQSDDSAGNVQVQALLDALHATTEFEAYLRRRFPDHAAEFQGPISRAFTPHLNVWVDFHERTLSNKLRQYQSHEWNEEPEGSDVLASSADVFIYYRSAMDQMGRLTTGKPFKNMVGVFARFLSRYAGLLQSYLPHQTGASGPASAQEIALAGKILKTADYCIATTNQLQQTIETTTGEQIAEAAFEDANDRFLGIVRMCLDVFVDQITTALKPSWREMANVNWARLDHAGDQSGYVNQMCTTLAATTAAVSEALTKPAHRRMVCDRLVDQVTHQFLTVVFTRVKPVSEVAAEQLLLDFYASRAALLDLNADEKFRDRTQRTTARVEDILKALLTQQDPPEAFVRTYLLLTKDASVANFRKVLEAKGVRPQSRYVDLFRDMAAAEAYEESAQSPLTHISMTRPPAPVASPPPEPLSKFSENFKRIGGFLRRDTPNASPLMR